MEEQLAAIVTAAGASTRMGDRHKALLEWCGRPLVEHQVRTLDDAGFDPVVAVTGADGDAVADALPDAAHPVHNEDWEAGRSVSLAVAAEYAAECISTSECRLRAVLVVAVDQPLEPAVLEELVDRAGPPVVQPVDDDGAGHPVVLGGEHLEDLRDIRREPEGLRSIVNRLRADGEVVPFDSLPHWDLNTPQAYREARDSAEHLPPPRPIDG